MSGKGELGIWIGKHVGPVIERFSGKGAAKAEHAAEDAAAAGKKKKYDNSDAEDAVYADPSRRKEPRLDDADTHTIDFENVIPGARTTHDARVKPKKESTDTDNKQKNDKEPGVVKRGLMWVAGGVVTAVAAVGSVAGLTQWSYGSGQDAYRATLDENGKPTKTIEMPPAQLRLNAVMSYIEGLVPPMNGPGTAVTAQFLAGAQAAGMNANDIEKLSKNTSIVRELREEAENITKSTASAKAAPDRAAAVVADAARNASVRTGAAAEAGVAADYKVNIRRNAFMSEMREDIRASGGLTPDRLLDGMLRSNVVPATPEVESGLRTIFGDIAAKKPDQLIDKSDLQLLAKDPALSVEVAKYVPQQSVRDVQRFALELTR